MREIKKYSNGKLYDTEEKKYITEERLVELVKSGEEVSILDNKTGENLTANILSQLSTTETEEDENKEKFSFMFRSLRKGGETMVDWSKKYISIWQNVFTMAEDEIDKLVNMLIKNKEITETEGRKLKEEIVEHADSFKTWLVNKIDFRINEIMGKLNLATKEQVIGLTNILEELNSKIDRLNELQAQNKE